jgi:transglutaminase-like putative cysteine protease
MIKKLRSSIIITLTFLIWIIFSSTFCILAADDNSNDNNNNNSEFYKMNLLEMQLTIKNSLNIVPTDGNYKLESVNADITFFPKNDFRQDVISFLTTPEAEIEDDIVRFTWINPKEKTLDYEITSNLRTRNTLKEINGRIPFPIKYLEPGYDDYIIETDTVDFKNTKIINLAKDIAAGEDDLYVVVSKYGEWVNKNIEYGLNTLTSDATQKASWVLENKEGVCDEITNLFIALCRSTGIPARFVSGLSYTNSELFTQGWSPHGWAEVYFPGYGWVPFDVTFGELGFVDATHIALKESNDANKSSSKYEWFGRNVNIETGKLDMEVNVIKTGELEDGVVKINSDIVHKEINFGSYDLFEVTLQNEKDYYVPLEVMISKTEEIKIFEEYNRYVLLKPKEIKIIYWIFETEKKLDPLYKYNFKINAKTNYGDEATANFSAGRLYASYSLDEIREYVNNLEINEKKKYSKEVEISCYPEKEQYIVGEDAKITCAIINRGTVLVSGLKTCMFEKCTENQLRIEEEIFIDFYYPVEMEGIIKLEINSQNNDISKIAYAVINSWKSPVINISELKYPDLVGYKEEFKIEFTLKKNNSAPSQNINAEIICPGIEKSWKNIILTTERKFILNIGKKVISEKISKCIISVDYKDSLGKTYSTKEEFTINVENIGFFDRITIWLNKIGKRVGI